MEHPDSDNVLEVQRKRCTDEMYSSFPNQCLSCVLVANDTDNGPCRFRNIRAFKRQPDTNKLVYGPYFTKNRHSYSSLKMPSALPEMSKEQRLHIQESIRPTIKQLLERDWKVMKLNQQQILRRTPSLNSRHTCDHCFTNVFNVYYMCTICGVDVCLDCFDLEAEWTINNNNNSNFTEGKLTSCTLGRQHAKSQFIPITKHTINTIQQLRLHTSLHIPTTQKLPALTFDSNPSPTSISSSSSTTSSVLSVSSLLSPEVPVKELKSTTTTPPSISAQQPPSTTTPPPMPSQQLPTTPLYPSPTTSPPNEHYDVTPFTYGDYDYDDDDSNRLLVASWKDITLNTFQRYWRHGKPAIIEDTMERSEGHWTPTYFCNKFGRERIDAIDCHTMEVKQMTIKNFFKRYHETDYQRPVLKIKDWPPGADFETECPTLYKDFMAMLPLPEYCSANGVYNLSSRLPERYIKPDLGPKMFIAYGLDPADKTCQVGTTNLHCDMTDAVNVMCDAQNTPYYDNNNNSKKYDIGLSATPGKAAAVWDIFAYDDLPVLRQFMRELLAEKVAESPSTAEKLSKLDAIHGQWIYLTDEHLKRLKNKYNVEPWRLYQNPGDTVFIPAGCAHQVLNRCNAIKCAYDFVSPENIDRSATITQQLGQAKQEDVLQLKTTLLYTWISVYKDSQTQLPTPPLDDDSPSVINNKTSKITGNKRKHEKQSENHETSNNNGKQKRSKKQVSLEMDISSTKSTNRKRKHEKESENHSALNDETQKRRKKRGHTPVDEL